VWTGFALLAFWEIRSSTRSYDRGGDSLCIPNSLALIIVY
jgi:hypothetical protein